MKTINKNLFLFRNQNLLLIAAIIFSATLMSCNQERNLLETNGTFFAISVSNIDDAINWYTKHLEFKVESKANNDQRKGALLTRQGVILELAEFSGAIHRNEVKPNLESHEVYGVFKIGFSTMNIDKTFKILKDLNVEIFFPIVATSDGNRTFGIKDLEGNIIQFFGK